MSELIYSISDLFDNFLNAKSCLIPEYQRGYKWGDTPVNKLLNDIERFETSDNNEDKFYCLNNLTLVKNKEDQDVYHVVDGQQRLTTITIILACLKHLCNDGLPKFEGKIRYEIRQQTQDFISKLIKNERFHTKDGEDPFNELFRKNEYTWDEFIGSNKEYDFQDIFYIFNAYKTIFIWLKDHENSRDIFIAKLLNNVKLIVNNVPDIENESTLFGNLNSNKVPLDGADLVRALIITNVAKIESENFDDTLKRKIHINERRVRIGLQIDSIMHWWKNPNHQKYYQLVTKTVKTDLTNNIKFSEENNPINHLYKLYSIVHNNGIISLDCFDKEIFKTWGNILNLQRVLEQWYDNDKLYHAIGFVLRHGGVNFFDLYTELIKDDSTIGEFYKYLLGKIKEKMDNLGVLEPNQDENKDWYDGEDVIPVMVLLDIISESEKNRRIPVEMFKKNDEDKEHIFPQTPLGAVTNKKDIKDRKGILKSYIELVNNNLSNGKKIYLGKPLDEWTEEEMMSTTLDDLQNEINKEIKRVVPIHRLGNICLLDKKVNRSYGNDFYTAKRLDIVHHYFNSTLIRPHVIEAFDKSWLERDPSKMSQEYLNTWNADDIEKRGKHIVESIEKYINGTWN